MSNQYVFVVSFKTTDAVLDFKAFAENRGATWNAYVGEDTFGKPALCVRGDFYAMAAGDRLSLDCTNFCHQMIAGANEFMGDNKPIAVTVASDFALNDLVLKEVVAEHQREIHPTSYARLKWYLTYGVPNDKRVIDLINDLGGVACAHYLRYRLEQDKWKYSLDGYRNPSAYVEFYPDSSGEVLPFQMRVAGVCPVIKYNNEPRRSPSQLDVLMTEMLHHVMRTYDEELADGECDLDKHPLLQEICDAAHIAVLSKRNGWAWANQVDVIDKFLNDYIERHRVSPP